MLLLWLINPWRVLSLISYLCLSCSWRRWAVRRAVESVRGSSGGGSPCGREGVLLPSGSSGAGGLLLLLCFSLVRRESYTSPTLLLRSLDSV